MIKTRNTKRILSVLLVCCLLLTMASGAVLADDTCEICEGNGDPCSEPINTDSSAEWCFIDEDVTTVNGITYNAGTVLVGEGTISLTNDNYFSPWEEYLDSVIEIHFTDSITAGKSLRALFSNLSNLVKIQGLDNFNTSQVENMAIMFSSAQSLESLNLSEFDTSEVTNMSHMFANAFSLESLDLTEFDTSNVTDMTSMFNKAESLVSLDLSDKFNTRNVTNMRNMFSGTISLQSLDLSGFDTSRVQNMSTMFSDSSLQSLDLSGFDTSSVVNMEGMFSNAKFLVSLDLSGKFNTEQVVYMGAMFYGTSSLTTIKGLNNFDTTSVTDMQAMFTRSSLQSLDLSGFNTNDVTDMTAMFLGMSSLQELKLGEDFRFVGGPAAALPNPPEDDVYTGNWKNLLTGNAMINTNVMNLTESDDIAGTWVWEMNEVCPICEGEGYPCSLYSDLTIGEGESDAKWCFINRDDTTVKSATFNAGTVLVGEGTINWTHAEQSPWDSYKDSVKEIHFTEQITAGESLSGLFASLENLVNIQGLDNIDTEATEDMSGMFFGAISLKELIFPENFVTSSVKNVGRMFYGASALETLNLSGFDTKNVTDMNHMFAFTSALESLDLLGQFNTKSVINMEGMFYGATSLESLNLSGFDTELVENMNHMFAFTVSLESLNLSGFNTENVTNMRGMFHGASALIELDLSGFKTDIVENMSHMFAYTSALETLNLLGFDTDNVTDMSNMFLEATALKKLILGEHFVFQGGDTETGVMLHSPEEIDVYTGKWKNLLTGNAMSNTEVMRLDGPDDIKGTWVWQKKGYTVTFKPHNSYGYVGDPVTILVNIPDGKVYGEAVLIPLEEIPADFELEDWEFTGWDDAGIEGVQLLTRDDLKAIPITDDTIFEAHWQPPQRGNPLGSTIMIIFDFNDGITEPEVMIVRPGYEVTADDIPVDFTFEGREFEGWDIDETADIELLDHDAIEEMQLYENTTFVAQWNPSEEGNRAIIVTFDFNDGTTPPKVLVMLPRKPVDTEDLPVNPIFAGHKFLGWDIEEKDGIELLSRDKVEALILSANTTFVAQWETVKVDPHTDDTFPNGGADDGAVAITIPTDNTADSKELHKAYLIGYEDGSFHPQDNMTRAEAATVFARTLVLDFAIDVYDLPEGMSEFNVFSDVKPNDWFYYYVAWAYEAGYVLGYPDGSFRPNEPITREEFAAMLVRAEREGLEKGLEVKDVTILDADSISSWATDYVNTALDLGLMEGDETGLFRPQDNITRAEVATAKNRILRRVYNREMFEAIEVKYLDIARRFPDVSETEWFFPSVLSATNDHFITRDADGDIIYVEFVLR